MAGEADEDVPPEFECSICMKLLLDPVTVSCGHTFCRACLDKSLGYRGLCAVCRAPVVAGQGVNILVRGIISERFPRALANRHREEAEELRAAEHEADERRRLEAQGAGEAGAAGRASPPATAAAAAGARTGSVAPVLPLVRGLEFGGAILLPHCRALMEVRSEEEEQMVQHALQGGRRIGALDSNAASFDDAARPLGVCFEIEHVERSPQRTRVRLVGKFRFWLVEPPQRDERGLLLGRCEAFFDEALPQSDLRRGEEAVGAEDVAAAAAEDVQGPTALELAAAAVDLLQAQLGHVGHGGQGIFVDRFGEAPFPTGAVNATTSAALERLSFWLLGALLTDATECRRWLGSVDTRARLEHCRAKLEAAGRRPVLNLPGANSWMSPGQSAFGSLALLIAVIALLIAKALGLFERGQGGRGSWHGREGNMQEALAFQALLR